MSINDFNTYDELSQAIFEKQDSIEWREVIPFNTEPERQEFPLDALPAEVAAFCEELSCSTQTPPELAGVLSLGVMAACLQDKYAVIIKRDYSEQLSLYTLAIAESGERKSQVINKLTEPLYRYEIKMREEELIEIEQNNSKYDLLLQTLDETKKRCARQSNISEKEKLNDVITELTNELAVFKKKYPYRLLADDTTVENLIDMLHTNDGCITLVSSEGGLFDTLRGRYEKNANLDVYCKGYSGDAIKLDRIGRNSNFVQNPHISMIYTAQRIVLCGLMNNLILRGKGLCGRFLYTVCKSRVGNRDVSTPPVSEKVSTEYSELLTRLLGRKDKGEIRLSKDANAEYIKYAEIIEKRLLDEWEHIRDWGGKHVGQMLRIAGLIHAVITEKPVDANISIETLKNAIRISECLSSHALCAYGLMGADIREVDAQYIWKRLKQVDGYVISKRDLHQKCRGKLKRMEDMTNGLDMLESMGYIQRYQLETPGAGRKSEPIAINPKAKDA